MCTKVEKEETRYTPSLRYEEIRIFVLFYYYIAIIIEQLGIEILLLLTIA